MYSDKQLKYWGQEIPKTTVGKTWATTLLVGLTTTNAIGQTELQNDALKERTILHGTITGRTEEGKIEPLGFTKVILNNAKIGVIADEFGKYRLDLTNYIDTIADPTVVFSIMGYDRYELNLSQRPKGELYFDPELSQGNVDIIAFAVRKPTLGQRIKSKFKKWFGRKNR